jgi:phosphopantothenoylcysteine decarboxylase/phosphopantothenate--cysteine ligase
MVPFHMTHSLSHKKILLGITGGIAAYKSADLVRRLGEAGASVRVVMTKSAEHFVAPLTFHALSGAAVLTEDTAESAYAMDHIALARWCDLILIAPATADCMAKLACGLADNFLSTLCLASEVPLILAPAMNQGMWKNPATQHNQRILQQRGVHFLGPAVGEQACGEHGFGRMLEPSDIVTQIAQLFAGKTPDQVDAYRGIHFLITAGPTREAIDPVRYISNRSSGKMGYALAEAAAQKGASVTLISGPTALDCPSGVRRTEVTTAEEMQAAVMAEVAHCNIFIGTAAVSDYRAAKIAPQKWKKNNESLQLSLTRNPDILSAVAHRKNPPFTVGFAAETENLRENAQSKLDTKKLDMVIANQVSGTEGGFESDQNAVLVLWKEGEQDFPLQPKKQLAEKLLECMIRIKNHRK